MSDTIRACCGTPSDQHAPSPHARDCRAAAPMRFGRMGYGPQYDGPYCIARRCTLPGLHPAGIAGCVFAAVPMAR